MSDWSSDVCASDLQSSVHPVQQLRRWLLYCLLSLYFSSPMMWMGKTRPALATRPPSHDRVAFFRFGQYSDPPETASKPKFLSPQPCYSSRQPPQSTNALW